MDGGLHLPRPGLAGGTPRSAARIGPNAVTRIAEALGAAAGEDAVLDLFATAGLSHHLADPPRHMVAERDVTTLHAALRARLGEAGAACIGAEAGRRTADYLLAHRIPRPLQMALRLAPPRLAARVLLGAIGRHAWTFSGRGGFAAVPGRPARVTIAGCPLCRGATTTAPACAYFAATLERLCQRLVHRRAQVRVTACQALGAPACVFEIAY
jgi:divinyl protochlorophyllide a 8-vinyl-reductase